MKKNIRILPLFVLILMIFLLSACSSVQATQGSQQNSVSDANSSAMSSGSNEAESQTINGILLVKTAIYNDKAKVFIPDSFSVMTEEMLKFKYPTDNRPTLVYTNESGSVNIVFNHTQNRIKKADYPEFIESFKSALAKQYPTAQFLRTGIETINGNTVGIIEVVTPAIDTDIYNLMWFTELDGRIFLVSFNCTIGQKDDWIEAANFILESFALK